MRSSNKQKNDIKKIVFCWVKTEFQFLFKNNWFVNKQKFGLHTFKRVLLSRNEIVCDLTFQQIFFVVFIIVNNIIVFMSMWEFCLKCNQTVWVRFK